MTAEPFADLPRGHFKAIMADPPWHFRARTALQTRNFQCARDAEKHYPTMGLDDIKALPVRELADKDAHLFIWTTGPCLRQTFEVMEAWGFRYSAVAFTWVKLKRSFNAMQLRVLPTLESDLHVGLGLTTRKNAEFCLLGRRGNARRNAKDAKSSCRQFASIAASRTKRGSGSSATATALTSNCSRVRRGRVGARGATKPTSSRLQHERAPR
jgi:N6-adenosine-specific RNA methylase IME4